MKSLRLDSAMAARLQRYGYSIDELAEVQEIQTAIRNILNLPGVSNDPVTQEKISNYVKGLFGYGDSDQGDIPQGTSGGNDDSGAFIPPSAWRPSGRKTESLPDISEWK